MSDTMPPRIHHDRHRTMQAAYGFGLFPVPPYRRAVVGPWRVVDHRPGVAPGYATRTALDPARYVLCRGRTVWMSTGLLEQESHAWHVHQATGTVVAAGLGMGLYAYAAAQKDDVARVVVIERSREVIRVMTEAAGFDAWPSGDKVTLLHADALAPDTVDAVRTVIGTVRPDYLYADIWSMFPAPEAPADTARMVHALRPRAAGWWGQELAAAIDAAQRGRPLSEETLRAYFEAMSVPVPVTPGYAAFCRDVGTVHNATALARSRRSSGRTGWFQRLMALFNPTHRV